MNDVFKNFYRNFYLRTNGYIPTKPLNSNVFPGDFFQIRNGEMIFLGNIFRSKILNVEDVLFDKAIKLNPSNWDFNDGVTMPFAGRDVGHNDMDGDFEFSRQIIAFKAAGSFFFRAKNPEMFRIKNWKAIEDALIIKLTQIQFSFRELYLVTETVSNSDWTLAISNSEKGELEVASNSEQRGLVDIFGNAQAKTIQTKDLEYYFREPNRKNSFFKAKKLAVRNEHIESFISDFISRSSNRLQWAKDFFDYDFYDGNDSYNYPTSKNVEASILDMLQANQLNPNTALQYFKWVDTNLDDIEKLFIHG